ncbi:MAG: peptidylprolyl isomerase [Candidatus Thermoplasmatota archaeon]|nr:peptidylprolyl isomerase [Candidatus Thermoplasmatota archaeon]
MSGRSTIALFVFAIIIFQLILSSASARQFYVEDTEDDGDCCDTTNRIAVLETDYGVIKFVLYEDMAPITTENFIGLAEKGHYDGVVFHRIVNDFLIQTGDGGGGQTIPLEIHPNATHIDGALGMARSSEPDSASDQFYICDGPQHGLDGDYAVFGVVISGIDVVRKIAEVPVYGENNPRPGSVIPSLWYNTGMPKEDVFVQRAYIEAPISNETADGTETYSFSAPGGGAAWILVFLVAPVALVALYLKQKRGK